MNRILRRIGALFLLLLLAAPEARSGGLVAVIINKDNPLESLEEGDIKKIYTNHMLNWPGGAPITIYDLVIQNPLREAFSQKILEKSPSTVAEEWAHLKITNQAKNPPHTMKSESLIMRRVASEKGAIGYVSITSAKNNPDVRVVFTIND